MLVTDSSSKAKLFNEYFYSVFTCEDYSNLESLKHSSSALSSIIQSVQFSPSDIFQKLVVLNTSKACGPPLDCWNSVQSIYLVSM